MNRGWEHFDHQADIGVRGFDLSMAGAFEQVAVALVALIVPPERVTPVSAVPVSCQGEDPDMLLADWLNAVIREMAIRKMIFSRFEVVIQQGRLEGLMFGERLDPERHEPAVEVKGASYHNLRVSRDEQGRWVAQCVVDV